MNRFVFDMRRLSLLVMLASTTSIAGDQTYSIDWFTIDGGGENAASAGVWELSGTIGQWDAGQAVSKRGGVWQVVGGFWGVVVTETDVIFKDGFEGES